jgi:hypothetical protein
LRLLREMFHAAVQQNRNARKSFYNHAESVGYRIPINVFQLILLRAGLLRMTEFNTSYGRLIKLIGYAE